MTSVVKVDKKKTSVLIKCTILNTPLTIINKNTPNTILQEIQLLAFKLYQKYKFILK